MQINDQQFIDAIHKVTAAEPDAIRPGSYWRVNLDKSEEGAFCVVGKALESIDERLCPRANSLLALPLLTGLGCSEQVAAAGYVAQCFNDMRKPWRIVSWAFDEAVERFKTYPDGITLEQAADMAHALWMKRYAGIDTLQKDTAEVKQFASGGIVTYEYVIEKDIHTLSCALDGLSKSLSKIAVNIAPLPVMPEFIKMGIEPPHTKQAHALSA